MTRFVRGFLLTVAALLLAGAMLFAIGLHHARADPIVRRGYLAMPDWPAGAKPVTLALLSDIHNGSWAMDPARLGRIVDQVDAVDPDLIVIAGDMVNGHDKARAPHEMAAIVAPLARLHAPLGTLAVLGNHDEWTTPGVIAALLRRAGITVLSNAAVRRGPLAVAGVGDEYTGHDGVPATLAALAQVKGARLIVSHSPSVYAKLPPDIPLLAGHTHCGQVVLPVLGAIANPARIGGHFVCGITHESEHMIVVTAGLGTSIAPVRYGAPPDLWLLTLGPPR